MSKLKVGQVFLFNGEDYFGGYGQEIVKTTYNAFKKFKYSGAIEFYLGNYPFYTSDYAVGIISTAPLNMDFWKQIEKEVKAQLDSKIDYIGFEPTRKTKLISMRLMRAGNLKFSDGTVEEIMEIRQTETSEFVAMVFEDKDTSLSLKEICANRLKYA